MRNNPNALMIFAAGFGTRMGDLTQSRPKPMIEVAGKPMIDHALSFAHDMKIGNIVVNTHYLSEVIEDHLSGQNITLINEAPDILETGGGLKNALPALGGGPCFTMNSDAIWKGPNPLSAVQRAWNPDIMDALLLLIAKPRALGHKGTGDFMLSGNGQISRGPGLVYSGVQIIKPELTANITERAFSLNILWDKLLQSGRIFGTTYEGYWCDVGSPEGIVQAEEMLANDAF